jgi:steroid 5-alpha reductase family enzyme
VRIQDLGLAVYGLALLCAAMAVVWAVQRRLGNAGWVDFAWTVGVGGLAVGYACCASGWAPRRVLVAVLAGTWAVRLGAHLAQRLRTEPEDGRYRSLRQRHGARFDRVMFGFFQAQAFIAVLLSLTFLVPCAATESGFGARDVGAVALWFAALCGGAVADRQLAAWRALPEHRGRTCRSGLWRYSRHPNYFFEWLHWLSYPVLAIGLPYGWLAWLAPALLLFLVLRVTGIPPTEAQALQSRGDDYRDYQRTTNAFFPGPPRTASAR